MNNYQSPPEDDGRLDYIETNANLLLCGQDVPKVMFENFSEAAMDDIFTGPDSALVFDVLIALGNGDPERATEIAYELFPSMVITAFNMVGETLE